MVDPENNIILEIIMFGFHARFFLGGCMHLSVDDQNHDRELFLSRSHSFIGEHRKMLQNFTHVRSGRSTPCIGDKLIQP